GGSPSGNCRPAANSRNGRADARSRGSLRSWIPPDDSRAPGILPRGEDELRPVPRLRGNKRTPAVAGSGFLRVESVRMRGLAYFVNALGFLGIIAQAS